MTNALLMDHWTVERHQETETAWTFWASYDIEPDACLKCGCVGRLYGHGSEVVPYSHTTIDGKPVTIMVDVRRYRCRECKGTFMQPLPDMVPGRRLTHRAARYIERKAHQKTWAMLSRELGIDEKTVRIIARDAAERREEQHRARLYAPLVLGIDELRLDGELRSVFTDGAHRRVLDLLPSRDVRSVHRWLSWLPGRDRVRIVTMDMWAPYRDAVQQTLPNALIVVDRWHVQKEIGKALDTVRVRLRNAAKSKKAKQAAMRGRRLLQRSRHRLSARAAFVLQGWLANNAVLKDAWDTKEALYDIWEAKTIREAEIAYLAARDAIPDSVKEEFGAVCRTIENWWEHIFPFFEFRYTNAYTEAANGLIKMANRAGRGYKFEQIRARALGYTSPMKAERVYVCESCLTRFTAEDGMFYMFGISMCPTCAEFHIYQHLSPPGHSTPQSG